jgi:hypothetical protein
VKKSEKTGFYKKEMKIEEHLECVMKRDWNVLMSKKEMSEVFKDRREVSVFREFCKG